MVFEKIRNFRARKIERCPWKEKNRVYERKDEVKVTGRRCDTKGEKEDGREVYV